MMTFQLIRKSEVRQEKCCAEAYSFRGFPMISRVFLGLALLSLTLGGCAKKDGSATDSADLADTGAAASATTQPAAMNFELTSSAFAANGSIPAKYTCEGTDISPPLQWSGGPGNARSYALIVDDPDAPDPAAPKMVYVHWVVYNIPAGTTSLAENAAKSGLPSGASHGSNDWKKQTYGGPCPPIGRHRYFHKFYALDTVLTGLNNPTKAQLEAAMTGHVIGRTELIGTYQKAAR
jgi:Raf kinase inhibitor-like YbhB/YbcL family protein